MVLRFCEDVDVFVDLKLFAKHRLTVLTCSIDWNSWMAKGERLA
jgi:hypothetical protein